MGIQNTAKEVDALHKVIDALKNLDDDVRQRIFAAAGTFLGVTTIASTPSNGFSALLSEEVTRDKRYPAFATDNSMSPKEFMFLKQPSTDVERVAALAFYLAHYRDMPQFKTLDLSKLNTEAAQPKFSNAASSANNAVKMGYLITATKGQKQISALGERFVNSLPDREAAKSVFTATRKRRKPRKSGKKKAVSKTSRTV